MREGEPKHIPTTTDQKPPEETGELQSAKSSVDAELEALRAEYADVADAPSSDEMRYSSIEYRKLYYRRRTYEDALSEYERRKVRVQARVTVAGKSDVKTNREVFEKELRLADPAVREALLHFHDRVRVLKELRDQSGASHGWYKKQERQFLSAYQYPFFHELIGSSLDATYWKTVSLQGLDYQRGHIAKFVEQCIAKLQSGEWQEDIPENKELVDEFARKRDILRALLSTAEKRNDFSRMLDDLRNRLKEYYALEHEATMLVFYHLIVSVDSNPDWGMFYYSDPSLLDTHGEVMKFLDSCIDHFQKNRLKVGLSFNLIFM